MPPLRSSSIPALAALILVLALGTGPALAAPPRVADAAQLQLALRKLAVTGTVLYVAAHPDDENTAFLAWLENEKMVRAGYLSMTRGDGGQNLIGAEKGDLLGVIRTQELLAARRIDGAEQFFTRAVDFGYSKTPEETLALWGKEAVLADVVWVIRSFRPDVIVTRFPATGEGGHGHHTASAILALEAFAAAGDPKRFPEQLDRVRPWSPRRVLWNYFSWAKPPEPELAAQMVAVDLGAYNPLLGRSYNELAAESRSMHKSQGFGSAERHGTQLNWYRTIAGPDAGGDAFAGVDLAWSRVAGSGAFAAALADAERAFRPDTPHAALPALLRARAALRAMAATRAASAHAELLAHKRWELDDVIRGCAGLWLEAVAATHTVAPGGEVDVTATAVLRSPAALELAGVTVAGAAPATAAPATAASATAAPATALVPNVPVPTVIRARLAGDPLGTQPHWLRRPARGGAFDAGPSWDATRAETPAALVARFAFTAGAERIEYDVPVEYRWTDRVSGEQWRPLAVAPEASIEIVDGVTLFPDRAAREVRVVARANRAGVTGTLRLRVADGWRVEPASLPVALERAGQELRGTFRLTPPAAAATATVQAELVPVSGSDAWTREVATIAYAHLPVQTVLLPAQARAVRLELKRRGERIGYVMGPGDDVPESLRQMGYTVELLSDDDLDSFDFARYDAIVTGVRAYNSRDRLKLRAERMLRYVEAGGTLVVQFNTADDTLAKDFAPPLLELGRDRVTVENAPVTFSEPRHAVLDTPNRIGPADFEGWVQERGLYFGAKWDEKYAAPLSINDPGEPARLGSLIVAPHGKGVFVYTGLAFFRQLPAGVPGAQRLFANLVSARSTAPPAK